MSAAPSAADEEEPASASGMDVAGSNAMEREEAAHAAKVAATAAAAVRAASSNPSELELLSNLDLWTVHIVDSEYARSKTAGGFRRLFPCASRDKYLVLLHAGAAVGARATREGVHAQWRGRDVR